MGRPLDSYERHDLHLRELAANACKTREEWGQEELGRQRSKMAHLPSKRVSDLIGRNEGKVYRAQKAEAWYGERIASQTQRIRDLTAQVEELEASGNRPQRLKKVKRKLAWAESQLIWIECGLMLRQSDTQHYICILMKWRGVLEKIHEAEVAKQIRDERQEKVAPYYGFGAPREKAALLHTDTIHSRWIYGLDGECSERFAGNKPCTSALSGLY